MVVVDSVCGLYSLGIPPGRGTVKGTWSDMFEMVRKICACLIVIRSDLERCMHRALAMRGYFVFELFYCFRQLVDLFT